MESIIDFFFFGLFEAGQLLQGSNNNLVPMKKSGGARTSVELELAFRTKIP